MWMALIPLLLLGLCGRPHFRATSRSSRRSSQVSVHPRDAALRDIALADLRPRCESAVKSGARLQMAYAWFPDRGTLPEIRYLLHCGADQPLQIWRCRPSFANHTESRNDRAASVLVRERDDRFMWAAIRGPSATLPTGAPTRRDSADGAAAADAAGTLTYTPLPCTLPEISGQ